MDKEALQSALQLMKKLRDIFNLDQQTYILSEEMLISYFQKSKTLKSINQNEFLTYSIIWLASRQQLISAIDGSIVQGAGISINSILTQTSDIAQLLNVAVELVCELKIDTDTQNYLVKIKLSYDFLTVFYKKLESTLNNIKDNENNLLLINISWLIYLILKKHILKNNDLVESACLLISVLQFIISQAISMCPVQKQFEELKQLSESNFEKFQKDLLTQLLFSFKVKDYELFSSIHSQSQQYINELIKTNVIKILKKSNQQITMLSASIINSNYRKLDQFYKSSLNVDDFDETLILPQRISTLTPKKITPITPNNIQKLNIMKKKEASRIATNQHETNQKFQRLLNYEAEQNITMSTNIKEIKLPTRSMLSPYAQQYVVATPMTSAMEMYNWVHDKLSIFKKVNDINYLFEKFLKTNAPCLENLLVQNKELVPKLQQISEQDIKLIDKIFISTFSILENLGIAEQTKKTLYWSLYIKYIETSPESFNESMLKCASAVCIDCVNFILSKASQLIEVIVPKCQLSNFQVWITLDHLLNNFDNKSPYQLKEHFLDLETKFISYHIWASDSQSQLISFIHQLEYNSNQELVSNNKFQRVFRRALHYCAFQIQIIGTQLHISESWLESVWITVKYILCDKTSILVRHSLDQICLSSFYGILKIAGNPIKFQQIINIFEQMNTQYSKQFIKKIVCNVHINEETMGNLFSIPIYQGDIVQFYNQLFIPTVKQFLMQLSNQMGKGGSSQSYSNTPINYQKNPALSQQVLQSPLRAILPSTPQQKQVSMTPSTKLLYAYTESPLLKIDLKSMKENSNSLNQPQRKIEYCSDTAEFIQKKCIIMHDQYYQVQQMKSKNEMNFAYLSQGTPKILNQNHPKTNNSFFQQQQTNVSSESNNSANYCKLLNFES